MGRLDDKWAKAGGVVQRAEQHIEYKLDALIAREDEVSRKTVEVFDRQNGPIDEQMKALDALDRKLDLMSNGGPQGPLPGSGDLQKAPAATVEPFEPPPIPTEPPPPIPPFSSPAAELDKSELHGAFFPRKR